MDQRRKGRSRNHRHVLGQQDRAQPFCRSLKLHKTPAAAAPAPRIFRAPLLRFAPNRCRAPSNASFTNSRLPITAPSVKYLTRHLSIFVTPKSLRTVSLSPLASSSSDDSVTLCPAFWTTARPGFFPSAIPIIRRYKRETSRHFSASKPTPSLQNQARTKPSRAFLPFPFFPPPIASP
jgi:hypothetical protein